jgi:hypothetical protein
MISGHPRTELFEAFSRELLKDGVYVRFEARGASMSPAIRDREIVLVKAVALASLRKGDIVLVKSARGFRLHRLVKADVDHDVFITRGDCGCEDDPAERGEEILGVAAAKEVRVGRRAMRADFRGATGRLVRALARGQAVLQKSLRLVCGPFPAVC